MTKRALLVAINRYTDAPLNGCLNDLALLYKVLKDIYGFTEFIILDDQRATKQSWLSALSDLGKVSKPGDWLVHCYSGHGSQIACNTLTASFETDRMDEIVIPYDNDWNNPLRDDDFNSVVQAIHPHVNLYFHIDSCFSGTMLRNSPPEKNNRPIKNRYLSPPLHVLLASGEMELDDELNLNTSRERTDKLMLKPFMKDTAEQGNAILISGCSDKQTSADFYTGLRYHGAMTYYLVKTLKEARWQITYSDLVDRMNQKLVRDGFDQTPQLEGRKELFNKNFLS